MDMQTEHIDDLIAGYALDMLDESERVRYEQHAAVCPPCSKEGAAAHETAQMLAFVAAAVPPPLTCKRKLFEKIDRERFLTTPTRSQRARPSLAAWVAVASIALLVLSSGWSMSLQRELADARAELEAQRAQMQPMQAQIAQYAGLDAMFRDPEVIRKLEPLGQATGGAKTFMKSGENDATLVVWGLPELPAGKVYKVWVARGEQQQPLESFEQTEQTMFIHIAPPEPMDQYQNIMITVEDDPSVTKPSEQTVLLGDL
jgi:hypothetical protein